MANSLNASCVPAADLLQLKLIHIIRNNSSYTVFTLPCQCMYPCKPSYSNGMCTLQRNLRAQADMQINLGLNMGNYYHCGNHISCNSHLSLYWSQNYKALWEVDGTEGGRGSEGIKGGITLCFFNEGGVVFM